MLESAPQVLLANALVQMKQAKLGITTVRNALMGFTVSPGIHKDVQWTEESIEEAIWRLREVMDNPEIKAAIAPPGAKE